MSSIHTKKLVFLHYFARSLLDGSPGADGMLTKMVSLTEDRLKAHDKKQVSGPLAFAALTASMEIGTLVMRQQLYRALGADIIEPKGKLRLARAKVERLSCTPSRFSLPTLLRPPWQRSTSSTRGPSLREAPTKRPRRPRECS